MNLKYIFAYNTQVKVKRIFESFSGLLPRVCYHGHTTRTEKDTQCLGMLIVVITTSR